MSAPQRMRAWGAAVAAGHAVLGAVAVALLEIPGAELFFGLCALVTLALSLLVAPLLRPRPDDGRGGGGSSSPTPTPGGGSPAPPPGADPPWWPEFERDLRAWLQERERAPTA